MIFNDFPRGSSAFVHKASLLLLGYDHLQINLLSFWGVTQPPQSRNPIKPRVSALCMNPWHLQTSILAKKMQKNKGHTGHATVAFIDP